MYLDLSNDTMIYPGSAIQIIIREIKKILTWFLAYFFENARAVSAYLHLTILESEKVKRNM